MLQIIGVQGIAEVTAGDDLARLITAAVDLQDGDVVVVSSKILSKAQGRTVTPAAGETPDQARRRLSLDHEVLAQTPHFVVVRTPEGWVCANAGLDASNMPDGGVLLLPEDCDGAAAAIRDRLSATAQVAVIISDTFGRAWREGQSDVALGVAGMSALRDERGNRDRDGRELAVTLIAVADQVAGAADLVRDKAAGLPVVVVRGLGHLVGHHGSGAELVRPPDTDLFAHGRGWLARRLATGVGRKVRSGTPPEWEWDLVLRAAGGGQRVGGQLTTADGLVAGRAEACLLDLGYGVDLEHRDGHYLVTVKA